MQQVKVHSSRFSIFLISSPHRGRELVMFMLENMHSELLCGVPDSEDIISFEHREYPEPFQEIQPRFSRHLNIADHNVRRLVRKTLSGA